MTIKKSRSPRSFKKDKSSKASSIGLARKFKTSPLESALNHILKMRDDEQYLHTIQEIASHSHKLIN